MPLRVWLSVIWGSSELSVGEGLKLAKQSRAPPRRRGRQRGSNEQFEISVLKIQQEVLVIVVGHIVNGVQVPVDNP